jgi:hypothetical protein
VTEKTTSEGKFSAGYLEVPLLLAITPSEGLGIHVGPVVGLRMGWNMTSEGTVTTTVNGESSTADFDFESDDDDGINSLDFGAALGLGYELESGLNFGFRYVRSLTTLNDDSEDGVFGSKEVLKINQNMLQVSIGFTFVKG